MGNTTFKNLRNEHKLLLEMAYLNKNTGERTRIPYPWELTVELSETQDLSDFGKTIEAGYLAKDVSTIITKYFEEQTIDYLGRNDDSVLYHYCTINPDGTQVFDEDGKPIYKNHQEVINRNNVFVITLVDMENQETIFSFEIDANNYTYNKNYLPSIQRTTKNGKVESIWKDFNYRFEATHEDGSRTKRFSVEDFESARRKEDKSIRFYGIRSVLQRHLGGNWTMTNRKKQQSKKASR